MDMMTDTGPPPPENELRTFADWCRDYSAGDIDRFTKARALGALENCMQRRDAPSTVEGLTDAELQKLPNCRGETRSFVWLRSARDAYLHRGPTRHIDEVEREAVAQVLEDLAQRVQAVAAAVRGGRSAIAAVAPIIDRLFP